MQKENLRNYVLSKGGQDAFLYYGIKQSNYLAATVKFIANGMERLDFGADVSYDISLQSTNDGFFKFNYEKILSHEPNGDEAYVANLNNSSYESQIENLSHIAYGKAKDKTFDSANSVDLASAMALLYRNYCLAIQVFHFHDTSDSSPLKSIVNKDDNLFLRSDGANIAAMLKLVYDKHPEYYRLIIDTVRMVVPDFHDFVIRDTEFITLEWFNKNNVDIPWKAYYLSDGSLRFIALAILLLMPTELQPKTIIIDEPELGLHPSAINILSGLIKRAANELQVIISTQSPALLANFEPQDIIVVDKKDKFSEFKRLNKEDLNTWLEDFSLPQLWDMNVIGGRP